MLYIKLVYLFRECDLLETHRYFKYNMFLCLARISITNFYVSRMYQKALNLCLNIKNLKKEL